ncbi:MAG TPA: hypothetical protein VF705_07240, partial [Longimicrobium sp.]
MSATVTITRKQGSIMGTVIAAVRDDLNEVAAVDFYVTVIDTRVGAVPVRLGPYPADILRRPAPGVYEKDVLLDTVYQTRVETVLQLVDGTSVNGTAQVFDARAPLIADASILVQDQDTAAGEVGRMVFEGQVVTIDSSTKVATFNLDGRYAPLSHTHAYLPLAGGTLTGGLNTTGAVYARITYSDSSGGVGFGVVQATSGVRRFALGLINNENGSNSGGNLVLWRYSDTGSNLGSPIAVNRATGVVAFSATPTAGGSALALASQLSAYLPLAGGTMTGQLVAKRDGGATPSYAGGQLELNSTGVNPVMLGFHRPGNSALGLRHASASLLELVNQDGGYATYVGATFESRGGNTSWGNARLYNGNEWGTGTNVYPTIGSTAGGGLIMLRRPHIPFHGEGSYVRMSTDAGVSAYWDMGLIGDEFKVRRSGSSAAFLIDQLGTAYIDRTDSWNGDIASGRNHLHLRAASDVAKRLTLTYSATGGTNDNGFGVIAAGRVGVGWTILALQPSGGAVCVGPVPTADYALNVNGPAYATGGLVSGTNQWLVSTAHASSLHADSEFIQSRSGRGILVKNHADAAQFYVAYEGNDFGLKNRYDAWAVRVTTMNTETQSVTLNGDILDKH